VSALRDLFERRRIDVRYALELVAGVASDLGEVRVADDAALVRYGYRVAGTVGLMMVGVLGVRAAEALPHAVDLGVAMQLTNICRDVREDAERGRVYLPASRLRALGVAPTPEGVLGARDAVRRVVTDLLALADRYYASAEDGMRHIPWRARLAILVASSVYRAIGVRLLSRGADALAGRTVVPFGGKLWAAVGAVLRLPWASLRRSPHAEALHGALVGLPGIDPGVGPA
jgi:phytoene synthase